MFGENPVRQSVTPISSATETNRFLKISNSIGLICMVNGPETEPSHFHLRLLRGSVTVPLPAAALADQRADSDDVSEIVDAEAEMRRNDHRGLAAGDDGRSLRDAARQQIFPAIDRRRHLPAAERGRGR